MESLASSALLRDKVAVVTGGASGIGRASVIEFLKEGCRGVVIVDLNDGVAERELVATLQKQFGAGKVLFAQGDVSRRDDVRRVVEATVRQYGTIDILFNNAGIQPQSSNRPLHELDEDMWDRLIAVNLKSVYLMSHEIIPIMLRSATPCVIINNSSVQGILSQKAVPAYAASKGAVNSLTRNMALDYAPHIRVLAVCPGATDTPLHRAGYDEDARRDLDGAVQRACAPHPFGRVGQPEEIARVVAFLASDRASFMSGSEVLVDGALAARGAWARS